MFPSVDLEPLVKWFFILGGISLVAVIYCLYRVAYWLYHHVNIV